MDLHLGVGGPGGALLAVASNRRRGAAVRTFPMGGALSAREQQRLQYAVIHCGRRRALHVVQIYGWAEGATAAADNARL
eukprot:6526635-Lingulodinium_polyedra.AAC.1